jgi:transcriptional regulator with XRE-family HTH domain
MTSDAAAELAAKLKQLRTSRRINQKDLAGVLGISAPLISSWENADALPPVDRLESYAEAFASFRSADEHRWRPVRRADLTEDEQAQRRELEDDLLALRAAAVGGPAMTPVQSAVPILSEPWQLGNRDRITIVCARLPTELRKRMPYADPSDPDYVRLYNYADLDSLIELHGHIRATNPQAEVRFKADADLVEDDYTTHLVLLGGVDWNIATRRVLAELGLPTRQVSFIDKPGDAEFEVTEGGVTTRFAPRFDTGSTERRALREDVAQFVRGVNPFNRKRTVSICNGMFGQGTYGAVRALTDARFRDRNAEYVREHFSDRTLYSLLFRVDIPQSVALTPDWTVSNTILHKWSEGQ